MQPSRAERRRLLSRCNRRAGCLALLIGFIFQALVFARVILSKRSIADDPVLHDVQSEAAIARLRRDWHAGGRRAYAGNDDGSGPEGLPDGGSTLLLNSEQRSSTGDTQHGTAASSDAAASIDDSLWEDADFSSAQPPPSRAAAATGLARRGDRGSRGPNGLIADLTDKKAEDNSDGSGAGGDAAQPAPSAGTNAPATAQQVAFDPGSDDVTVPSEPYNASDPQGIGAFMRKYVVPPDEPLKCAASQKAERRLAVSLAPVRVAVMTSHFFGDYEREVECSYGGCPLKCTCAAAATCLACTISLLRRPTCGGCMGMVYYCQLFGFFIANYLSCIPVPSTDPRQTVTDFLDSAYRVANTMVSIRTLLPPPMLPWQRPTAPSPAPQIRGPAVRLQSRHPVVPRPRHVRQRARQVPPTAAAGHHEHGANSVLLVSSTQTSSLPHLCFCCEKPFRQSW